MARPICCSLVLLGLLKCAVAIIPRQRTHLVMPGHLNRAHCGRTLQHVAVLFRHGGAKDEGKHVAEKRGHQAVTRVRSACKQVRSFIVSTLVVSLARDAVAPLAIILVNVVTFFFKTEPHEHLEMDGRELLQNNQWYRMVTSLFLHRTPEDLKVFSAIVATFGTLCSRIFDPYATLWIYMINGWAGNLAHLIVYALGSNFSHRYVGLPTLRETLGRLLGDLGIPTNAAASTSMGAALGLVTATWAVIVRHLEQKHDMRTLPWFTRGFIKGTYALTGVVGTISIAVVALELLFPKFGKVAPLGGALTGALLGAVLPYHMPPLLDRILLESRPKRILKAIKAALGK